MQQIKLSNLYKKTKNNRDIFHELMSYKVKNVLLFATHYDAYNIVKEEQFTEKIHGVFLQLNLFTAPQLFHVSTEEEAFEMLKTLDFDLVIIMVGLNKKHSISISKKIKLEYPGITILLLVNNNSEIAYFQGISDKIRPYVHKIFVWNGSSEIFMAMIKYIEDLANLAPDVKSGDVRIILLVEDSIKYYSRYLPIVYTQLMLQTQELILDENVEFDEMKKVSHIRARPKLILRSRYESAIEIIDQYPNNLLCIITDMEFSNNNVKDTKAGIKLLEYVQGKQIDIPIVIQSSDTANAIYASRFNFSYINKSSNTLATDIQNFLKESLGFGSFVYRNHTGTKVFEAFTLQEFEQAFYSMPDEVILNHAQRDDFSKWLIARGEIYIAQLFREQKSINYNTVEEIRNYCINAFKNSRLKQISGKIIPFRPVLIPYSDKFILKIGKGSLGGKGRGIAFISNFMESIDFKKLITDINITIPKTTIIGTDIYDSFIEINNLAEYLYDNVNYQSVRKKFFTAKLPKKIRKKLIEFLKLIKKPLVVRSSGLFEDSLDHPFAGVYTTYFLTNNHKDLLMRYQQLENAIKLVYASIFTSDSSEYFKAIGYKIEEEKMAIIIQEFVGNDYNGRYYPLISGVAQSYNFYPFSYIKPEDGYAALCIGTGSYVVDGENAFRICPKYPKLHQMTINDQMKHSQQHFYALDMAEKDIDYGANHGNTCMKKYKIATAEKDGNLTQVASVYDYQNQRIEPDLSLEGPRIINFENILTYESIPLAKTLNIILKLFHQAMDSPIEIEFAVELNKEKAQALANLYLLQIRPLIIHSENVSFNIKSIDKNQLLVYSSKSIGNGKFYNLSDIIYVDIDSFDKTKTDRMVSEVAYFNQKLQKENKQYVLIGPGRWGTKDRFTGIPITWSQIANAKVIVEHDLSDFPIEASLGSHFFHNVTTMNVGYLSVNLSSAKSIFNYEMLTAQPVVEKLTYLRHIRFDECLCVIIDGKKQKGVIHL